MSTKQERASRALTNRLRTMLEARGIEPPETPANGGSVRRFREACREPVATVVVHAPMAVVTRLAHAAADAKIAVDPAYDATCAALDAGLAGILAGVAPSLNIVAYIWK